MKLYFAIIICFAKSFQAFTQQDTSLLFVEDAIRTREGINKIVYLDSSLRFYHNFKTFVRNGVVEGFEGRTKVIIKFTGEEVQQISREFRMNRVVKWPDSLFTNSVRINADTLLLLTKDTGSRAYFKGTFANKYFYFSHPVFVRDKTISIFRMAEMVGDSAGRDFLFFYSLEGDRWKQTMVIHLGDW